MRKEHLEFIKEKFKIDLTKYDEEKQEQIISIIEENLSNELITARKKNFAKKQETLELLEQINRNQ